MSIANRISSLKTKHDQIEKNLKDAYLSHQPNSTLNELKKKKLALKEEIQSIEARLPN